MRELKQVMKPSIAGFDLIFGRLTGLEDAFCLGSVKDFEELVVTRHSTLLELCKHLRPPLQQLIYQQPRRTV